MDTNGHVLPLRRIRKNSVFSMDSDFYEIPKNKGKNHCLNASRVSRRRHSDLFDRNPDTKRVHPDGSVPFSKSICAGPLYDDEKGAKKDTHNANSPRMNILDLNTCDGLLSSSETCEDSYTISIHETYQLGYYSSGSDKNYSDLYVFDFVDGLEVSYPVTVPSLDALPLDLPPLFVERDYVDKLTDLASTALNQLAQVLNNWFVACQSYDDQVFIWRHLTAHEEAVQLRRLIVELLSDLSPHCDLKTLVDVHSPATDRILSRITSALTMDTFGRMSQDAQPEVSIPVVSLCPDPPHCVTLLRNQIVALLKQLLPQLDLPQSFDCVRDLQSLLATVRDLNRKVTV